MMPAPRWPDAVPPAWTKCQFQYAFHYQQRGPLPNDEVVTAFRDGQVTLRRNRREDGFTNAAKEIGYQHIVAGDLVVHAMDGGFGAIGVSDSDGKASPVVHAYRSERCDVHFMAYYLKAAVSAGWIAAHTKGIRERSTQFDRASLSRVEVAFPDLTHQRSIVRFLDRELAEIDAMDAELNHLIQTLQERKTERIRLATTESAEWPVAAMQYVCSIETGERDTADAIENGVVPFYVRSPHIEAIDKPTHSGEAVLTPGDGAGVGKIYHHHRNGEFAAHQRVYVMRDFRQFVDPRFFFWAFSGRFGAITEMGTAQSTVPSLRRPMLAAFPIPLPPIQEQRRIAAELDEQTARIDDMIADTQQLKALLAERRSTLITDVVTGEKEVPA